MSEMAQVEPRSGRVEAPASAIEPVPMNPRRMGSGPPPLPVKTSVAASPLMASMTSNAASASASPAAVAASEAAAARSGALAFLGGIGPRRPDKVPTLPVHPTRGPAARWCRGRGARTPAALRAIIPGWLSIGVRAFCVCARASRVATWTAEKRLKCRPPSPNHRTLVRPADETPTATRILYGALEGVALAHLWPLRPHPPHNNTLRGAHVQPSRGVATSIRRAGMGV